MRYITAANILCNIFQNIETIHKLFIIIHLNYLFDGLILIIIGTYIYYIHNIIRSLSHVLMISENVFFFK